MERPIDRLIKKYGGISALARELRLSRQAVHYWKKAGYIPLKRIILVENMTGIPREELRPDFYIR